MTALDPSRCPACGGPNHCARAGNSAAGRDCWCHHVQVSAAVIAALPADAKARACLCAACARGDTTPTPTTLRAPRA